MRDTPSALRTLLSRLGTSDAVKPVDVALARLLGCLEAEHGASADRMRTVALTAVLLSLSRRAGHSALDLPSSAEARVPGEAAEPLPTLPALDAWRDALAESHTVGAPGSGRPLVMEGGRVWLRRFWKAERRVAHHTAQRLGTRSPAFSVNTKAGEHANTEPDLTDTVREAFRRLFPNAAQLDAHGEPDWQAVAAASALRQRVLLVAGGPGTGKTYTATRLLALQHVHNPKARIALAAPTGKAAQRLSESLTHGAAALPDGLGGDLPTEARTLHRLLGYHPARGFAYDARRPLPADLVLVDEGSMIDLPLFDALLAALPEAARLVILGDPDQLASVEAGAVFSDLVTAGAGGLSADLAAFCEHLGLPPLPHDADAPPASDAVMTLTRSRRFGPDSDLGRLARLVQRGDPKAALTTLRAPDHPEVQITEPDGDSANDAVDRTLSHARQVLAASTPEEALQTLARQQTLAVVRRGPRGVEGLNAAVEDALRASGAASWNPWGAPFYRGRPLLITANDDDAGLANGDVGVCWTKSGQRMVCFPDPTSGFARRVPPARLPAHEPAWAITVHKSQGSEFDRVILVLPDAESYGLTLLSRELLYTALTRARTAVTIDGDADLVRRAIATPTRRRSGLADRLQEALRTD